MELAPYAVFVLIASVVANFGFDLLQSLLIYTVVVVAGLMLHAFGTYGLILRFLARLNPGPFYKRIAAVAGGELVASSLGDSGARLDDVGQAETDGYSHGGCHHIVGERLAADAAQLAQVPE